jgi:hypothetical protein
MTILKLYYTDRTVFAEWYYCILLYNGMVTVNDLELLVGYITLVIN